MLEEVLTNLKNWFEVPDGIHEGTFEVKDGSISLPFLLPGQYFRVCGSVFNDGLHKYPDDSMTDEEFTGAVWALAVPNAVIKLAEDVTAWQEKNGDAGPYSSESFGGYSYTRATDARTGGAVTWQSVFRSRLAKWRKI